MAKKKKKSGLGTLLALVGALLALAAVFMMFLPAASIKDTDTTFTGIQMTFGYSKDAGLGTLELFGFSFMNFLPYILVLAGIAFSVLTVLGKLGKIAPLLSAVCYLGAGILFLLAVVCCVPNADLEKLVNVGGSIFGEKVSVRDCLALGVGAILAGVLSILASLCSAAALVIKK